MRFKRLDRVWNPATGAHGFVRGFMVDYDGEEKVIWERDDAPLGLPPYPGKMLSCLREKNLEFEPLADVIELDGYRITTVVERVG